MVKTSSGDGTRRSDAAVSKAKPPHTPSHARQGAIEESARAAIPAGARGGVLTPQHILSLQRSAGNQAVQRLLTQGGQRPSHQHPLPIQRKMNWYKTDWGKAKYLTASSGGGGGVLFVGEAGREVVVKPGEDLATETALASMLINKVGRARRTRGEQSLGKGKGKGGMSILAPGIRTVDKDESSKIRAALSPLVDKVEQGNEGAEAKFRRDRARNLVDKVGGPGVLVQDVATGKELKEVAKLHDDHTEASAEGGIQMKATSALNIFQDRRSITALGRITAVDLFTGNKDRLVGLYNAENLMVTTTSVTAIDNIWMGSDAGVFQTTLIKGQEATDTAREVPDRRVTRDDALNSWMADGDVKNFAEGNFAELGEKVFEKIKANATIKNGLKGKARIAAENNFGAIMDANKDFFLDNFAAGLKAGKKQLVASLNRLLRDKSKLKKLAPGVDLAEIMDTVRKRKRFIQGKDSAL